MRSTLRRAAAVLLGTATAAALAAGPGLASSSARTLHRATARAVVTSKVSAHRTVRASMSATAVADVPGGHAKPVRITATASASRTGWASARASAGARATARAGTPGRARAAARTRARHVAAVHAHSRAATLAAHAAAVRATSLARSTALASAKRLAATRAATAAHAAAHTAVKASAAIVATRSVAQSSPCGGEQPARTNGGVYTTCTFDDEFTGSGLDATKWTAMDTRTSHFHIGDECFAPKNASVSGGALALTGTRGATSNCDGRNTAYQSGLVSTAGHFSQTYGRFEIRAKFPTGMGFGSGFWMLPQNASHDGGYEYGEIDVVENWGVYKDFMWAHLHYVTTPDPDSGAMCRVQAYDGGFHTYAVDWTSKSMTFSYDNQACWTTTWQPVAPKYAATNATAPTPFDQPFYLILNLTLGGSASTATVPLSTTKLPAAMQVDYVRVWK